MFDGHFPLFFGLPPDLTSVTKAPAPFPLYGPFLGVLVSPAVLPVNVTAFPFLGFYLSHGFFSPTFLCLIGGFVKINISAWIPLPRPSSPPSYQWARILCLKGPSLRWTFSFFPRR